MLRSQRKGKEYEKACIDNEIKARVVDVRCFKEDLVIDKVQETSKTES